jgi:LacI family transcriptional regulator
MPTEGLGTPTLADVARAAGVHPGTASKALGADWQGIVAASTMRKVRAAADRLGYQPNAIARSLRTRRSFSVGVLIPDLTNPLFPPIVRGLEEVFRTEGLVGLVVNTDNDLARAASVFAALQARQCDGYVLATARRSDPLVEEMARLGTPAVLINRLTDRRLLPAVAGDEVAGVASAVEHLVELGHRSIAHIAGPPDLSTGYVRERAFRESVRRYDLVASDCPSVTADAYSEAAGHTAALSLLAGSQHPTAIVASNDLLALGAIDGLRERGLTCPDNVSVVGFNDMPFLGRMSPALTTIRLPKREIGVQAARLLLERLTDSSEPDARCILLPCPLIVRESTAPPPR